MSKDLVDTISDLKGFIIKGEGGDRIDRIASVKYRSAIADFTEPFLKNLDVNFICPTIVFDNGKTFHYTCNNPALAEAYSTTGLKEIDKYFEVALSTEQSHFFPPSVYKDTNKLQLSVIDILQSKFGMYNSFGIVRNAGDFSIVIGVGNNKPSTSLSSHYVNNNFAIDKFIINYFDRFINLYIDECAALATTRFAMDENFRKQVLLGKYQHPESDEHSITKRERECLYWSSKGKSADEIAILMKISKHTVNEHRKSLIKKLNATNITHAVHIATKLKLIL